WLFVDIFAALLGDSGDLHHAVNFAMANNFDIHQGFEVHRTFDCHIDTLFGIGLNRELNDYWQHSIQQFNEQAGLKISIDIP
ncbi:NAD(P)H-hydrate epimerase, partial [Acinetobacter baumannii]